MSSHTNGTSPSADSGERASTLSVNGPGTTILSANVPEPTSYPGRHYILLNLPDAYWRSDLLGQAAPATPALSAASATENASLAPRATTRIDGNGDDTPPYEIQVIECDWKSPSSPLTVTSNSYQLNAVVTFPAGGEDLFKDLHISVDSATSVALQSAGGHDYSAHLTLAPGAHLLYVRGLPKTGTGLNRPVLDCQPLAVTVNAAPEDTPPPTLTVSQPADGSIITLDTSGNGRVAVQASATSTAGVHSLAVELDGQPVNGLSGDASSLSGTIQVTGIGDHTVTVTATDSKGGQTTVRRALVAKSPTLRSSRFKLVLVECLQLSSFLGAYGNGRVLKSFSLLPGEKTSIKVESYVSSEQTLKDASSILDSYSTTQSDAFEQAVNNEQSTQTKDTDEAKNAVKVHASASWGFGSADASYDGSWASSSARDEMVKNVRNATTKHAAEASAKRDVHIDTSTTTTDSSHTTTTTAREISNINVSRTLNFVFRQMNQEFFTLLHLVDVRIGLLRYDDDGAGKWEASYQEFTLPQLDGVLRNYLRPNAEADGLLGLVRNTIFAQLDTVYPFNQSTTGPHPVSLIEQVDVQRVQRDANGVEVRDAQGDPVYAAAGAYFRFRAGMTSTYTDPATGSTFTVPGVLLAADQHVMRTDGILVEAVLGEGDALDEYNRRLQVTAYEARAHDNYTKIVTNELSKEELERLRLARSLVEAASADDRANVYAELFATVTSDASKSSTGTSNGAPGKPTPGPALTPTSSTS